MRPTGRRSRAHIIRVEHLRKPRRPGLKAPGYEMTARERALTTITRCRARARSTPSRRRKPDFIGSQPQVLLPGMSLDGRVRLYLARRLQRRADRHANNTRR
jgi:hypothetical protein